MFLQAPPATPQPIAGEACVYEGAAKAMAFDQLPEAIQADLKKRTYDLWIPGKKFDPAEPNFGSPKRFLAAARLDLRYVVAIEHDGWSFHVGLLTYDMSSPDITPKAERNTERRPTCEDMAVALKARLYPQTKPLIP